MPIFTVLAVACPEAEVVAEALATAAARTAAPARSLRVRAIAKPPLSVNQTSGLRGMLTQPCWILSGYCMLDESAPWAVPSAVV